jgi:signal peptidase I
VIPEKQRKALLRELAETSAGAEFTCNSASMEPTIMVGEKVRVHAVPTSALRVGDVVVYEGDGIYMLHRIVLISPLRNWFLHIGDAPTMVGPRRARMSAIVGRTNHPWRMPKARLYILALKYLVDSQTPRYFYW